MNNINFGHLMQIWMFALAFSGVWSALIVTPENMAVESGQSVTMTCESNTTQSEAIIWMKLVGTGTETVCRCGDGINSDPFRCISGTGTSCDFFIQNVSSSLAGIYRCQTIETVQTSYAAQLIVLETKPKCMTQPSDRVNVTDSVKMSCGVTYTGSVAPVMIWFNSMGQQLNSTNHSTSGSADYTTSVTAEIPSVLAHTCNTSFTSSPPPPSEDNSLPYATNVPSYNKLCNTSPVTVQYAPFSENITIEGLTDEIYLGSTLQCIGDTEPAVFSYEWSDDRGETVGNNYTLSLDQTGQNLNYTCTVCNLLGRNQSTITVNVVPVPATTTPVTTISTVGSGTTTTTGSTITKGYNGASNTAVIVGAVIGSLAAVVIVIILVVCFVKESCPIKEKLRKKRNEKNEQKRDMLPARSDNFGDVSTLSKADGIRINKLGVCLKEMELDSVLRQRRPGLGESIFPYFDDNDIQTKYDPEYKIVYNTVKGS